VLGVGVDRLESSKTLRFAHQVPEKDVQ
jgi:hypothetical protein